MGIQKFVWMSKSWVLGTQKEKQDQNHSEQSTGIQPCSFVLPFSVSFSLCLLFLLGCVVLAVIIVIVIFDVVAVVAIEKKW